MDMTVDILQKTVACNVVVAGDSCFAATIVSADEFPIDCLRQAGCRVTGECAMEKLNSSGINDAAASSEVPTKDLNI